MSIRLDTNRTQNPAQTARATGNQLPLTQARPPQSPAAKSDRNGSDRFVDKAALGDSAVQRLFVGDGQTGTVKATAGKSGKSAKSGELKTYMGNENSLVPEDGHLRFQARTKPASYWPMSTTVTYPDSLRLRDGRKVSTRIVEDDFRGKTGLLIRDGKNTLMAMRHGSGSLRFYRKAAPGHAWRPDNLAINNQVWIPLTRSDSAGARELAQVYREAYRVAVGWRPRISPQDKKLVQDAKQAVAMTNLRAEMTEAQRSLKHERGHIATAASLLGLYAKQIGPGIAKGFVKIGTDREGKIILSLARPKGMDGEEWRKVQDRFGGKLRDLQSTMQREQNIIASSAEMRNDAAQEIYDLTNSDAFYVHLSSLSPEDRAIELSNIAQDLIGTPAAKRFATDLVAARYGWHKGSTTGLAKMFVQDLPTTPKGRTAVAGMMLALAPHLGVASELAFNTAFDFVVGRPLNKAELNGMIELSKADSPKHFDKLLSRSSGALSAITAFKVATEGKGAGDTPALKRAGHYLALFKLGYSTYKLAKEGANFDNVSGVATSGASAWGTWASLAARSRGADDWLVKYGKVAGKAAGIAELALDIRTAAKQTTSEGKHRAWVHAASTGVIVVGAAVGSPIAVGAAVIATTVKLFYGRTSANYEAMNKTLKYAF